MVLYVANENVDERSFLRVRNRQNSDRFRVELLDSTKHTNAIENSS